MKRIKLQEASSLSAYDKMRLFDIGQRRENIKACNTIKLTNYYRVCLNNGFHNAETQIAVELVSRGVNDIIVPEVTKIDATQFTPYEAQFILKNQDDPLNVMDAALIHPFPNLTASETLTVYLIWAISLDLPDIVASIKTEIRSYNTYYSSMPAILTAVLNNPGVADVISDIIKGLPAKYKKSK